jgi:DNA-binding protein H-NS
MAISTITNSEHVMSEYQDLLKKIAELEDRASAIRETERSAAIVQIKSLMETFSIQQNELAGKAAPSLAKKVKNKTATKAPAKYRDASGNEWTGRGLQPRWLRAELAKGATLESFAIAR